MKAGERKEGRKKKRWAGSEEVKKNEKGKKRKKGWAGLKR